MKRRSFLLGVSGAALLSACGTPEAGKQLSALRIATGAGTGPGSLDPAAAGPGPEYLAMVHLYDQLISLRGDRYELDLAESITPDATAKTWTIQVRQGIRFHDNRPLRAADVAYSLRHLADPAAGHVLSAAYADVDRDGIRALDDRTVVVPLRRPRGDFRDAVLSIGSMIFPEGTTEFGVGTGPYRLGEHKPGQPITLTATGEHHARNPALRTLTIAVIADPEARARALTAGQYDYVTAVTATAARIAGADRRFQVVRPGASSSSALLFAMNTGLAPFTDPRVRTATRLAADRPGLVGSVLPGQGAVGNDVIGMGLPGYADGLAQHQQDLDRARSLFAEAGVHDLVLRAAPLRAGLVDSAQLFARTLGQVGVNVRVDEVSAAAFFADLRTVSATPFQAFYYINRPAATHLALNTSAGAGINPFGYGDQWHAGLTAAQSEVDDAARAGRFAALQRTLHEDGGEVLWGYDQQTDLSVSGVDGVDHVQTYPVFTAATA